MPSDLRTYGLELAVRMPEEPPKNLLVGLSVVAQAAAVAAAASQVPHLMLRQPDGRS